MAKAKKQKTRSIGKEIAQRLKEFVEVLESGEDLRKRFTCRTVRIKLEPQKYSPALVKKTRKLLGASQEVFARFLGVSASAVQDWEQGTKPPRGSACRLMDEIRANPEYWIRRLEQLCEPVGA
jgi:putative transcriptional regulator